MLGRNYKALDEKLVEKNKEGVKVGAEVTILGGSHKGLSGRVVAIQKSSSAKSNEDAFGMSSKKSA